MLKLKFGRATSRGRDLVTPRYAFIAQNAFYGLVANLTTDLKSVK